MEGKRSVGAEDRAAEASHGVEIVLAQGRTVHVRAGFDRQTLVETVVGGQKLDNYGGQN